MSPEDLIFIISMFSLSAKFLFIIAPARISAWRIARFVALVPILIFLFLMGVMLAITQSKLIKYYINSFISGNILIFSRFRTILI